ncbi:MAG: HAD family phosphatase [Pseudomonadota bacterium]
MTALVFDVGKVLLEWDLHTLFEPLLGSEHNVDAFLEETDFHAFNLGLDAGKTFADSLPPLIDRFPHHKSSFEHFRDAWTECTPGPIDGTAAILEDLKTKGTPLYAITNFSAENWPKACAKFPFLATSFRDVIVSGAVKMLKPDPAIYELLLTRNGLDAADCLFIDDSPKNVAGARAVGMQAIQFTGPHALRAALTHRGFL